MTRVGSRSNSLVSALLAAADAGAFTLPPGMAEAQARLASMQAVAAAALRAAPDGELRARAVAVQALLGDPAEDVVAGVIAGRQADDEHRLRCDLLAAAVEVAADDLDVFPEDLVAHLQDAHSACVARLKSAFATFSPVSTNPDDLWGASPQVRGAWTSFTRAAVHFELLRGVWVQVRVGSPSQVDLENLFSEIVNVGHVWPERVQGLRPFSTMVPPWPPRSDGLAWLLWAFGAGAVLHLPTVEQQDSAWLVVFGERARVFGAGDAHVRQMRETFG